MKTWTRMLGFLVMGGCMLVSGRAALSQGVEAAIQAIQQAPDPSAAVAAYANGFALERNNPRLAEAYVSRMVDLGLPELAYHQAHSLTSLEANNGLAWGVVAYVDARRAQMPEAVSAINLAGQFAPDNKFVQHTAGELLAWYDFKADKNTLPANAKVGLVKVRALLGNRPEFTSAYTTAQKAYQSGAAPGAPASYGPAAPGEAAPPASAPVPGVPNAPQVPPASQVAPAPQAQVEQVAPMGYVAGAPAVYYPYDSSVYYYPAYSEPYLDWAPEYAYGWGPGWIAPNPWWWWQPCGYWSGSWFYPFGVTFAFGSCDDWHHGQHHDGANGHGGHHGHDGTYGHGHDSANWHNGSQGQHHFYGTPARPSTSTRVAAQASTQARSTSAATATRTSASGRWWSGAGQHSSFTTVATGSRQPNTAASRWGAGASLNSRSSGVAATPGRSGMSGRSATAPTRSTPAVNSASGSYRTAPAPRSTWTSQSSATRSSTGKATIRSTGQSSGTRTYGAPSGAWSTPGSRTSTYSTPRYSPSTTRSYGGNNAGHWNGSSMSSSPRSSSGAAAAYRGGSSYTGGRSGGGSFSGGGARGGGFSSGGGAHVGGGGGGGHGGGHR